MNKPAKNVYALYCVHNEMIKNENVSLGKYEHL
jgi:hypothetical protein